MTTQMLIYERAVPLASSRHRDWSVKVGRDHGFARQVNSVPLTAVEFPAAAREYAIVFAKTTDSVLPAVVLGVRDKENLYVSESGEWGAQYVPAFIRRYPFVFASTDDGDRFTLCIDEEFSGCNQDGLGERLFDSEGEQTQYLGGVLEFLKAYQVQFQRTEAFCKKLNELELLEPVQARFRLPSGEQAGLSGVLAINRERLKALGDDKLAELARSDELELIYLHLHSVRNLGPLAERISPQAVVEGNDEPVEDTAPGGPPGDASDGQDAPS